MPKRKPVDLALISINPDGSRYKLFDPTLGPPKDKEVIVRFFVDEKEFIDDKLTPDGLASICNQMIQAIDVQPEGD